jgi:SAM-dependent methyltransferase
MMPYDRKQLFLSLIDTQGLGLEIGPGFNPLLPKSEGFRIETLDHASQADLVAKYSSAVGVDLSRIEVVDHVVKGTSIFETIGLAQRYDYIVASHVIEHTPDMLAFLQDCERLLKPQGVLALAVPDKRFSFDVLRPLTSTGDVLQAHVEGRKRHSPGRIFDEIAYNVLREGALSWPASAVGELAFVRPLKDAKWIFEAACNSAEYLDIHAWQFTPSSFRLIASDLHELEMLGLRELSFDAQGAGEFITGLARHGGGPGLSRLQLAQRAMAEQQAIEVQLAH